MTNHLQAAKDLMADRPDDGDVFAAQTHAMIALVEAAIRAQAEMSLADDEIVVRLPKTEIVPSKPDLLRMYADGAPNPRIAGWLRAIADGIERKEGLR